MRLFTITVTLVLCLTASAAFAGGDVVFKQGMDDVKTTMDRFEALVKSKGMTVFARLDHQANAQAAGFKLADSQLLIFGNPKIGSRVMMHDIRAGLDLPLKVLVYKGNDGNTWLSYRNPQVLKRDFAVSQCVKIDAMEKAMAALADKALSDE